MVKIKFLGACHQVGRSGILIESEETEDAILMDYGTAWDENGKTFPEHVSGRELSAIVLSHAHLDHSGALPLFYISGSVPLYTTKITYRTIEILLQDMFKITQSYLPFERDEIRKMNKYTHFLPLKDRQKVGVNSYITFFNAGHIPGSVVVLVEMDGKSILYTGDVNTADTQLLVGFDPKEVPPIDAIITETTYGHTERVPREELEEKFLEAVHETINGGGNVIVPAFGVGRSQEIVMVLGKHGVPDYKVYLDGMARKVAQKYKRITTKDRMYRDREALVENLRNVEIIPYRYGNKMRHEALTHPSVIVAPSGMLKGGTIRFYAERIISDPKNLIALISYQVEGTPGRILMEKGIFVDKKDDVGIPVEAQVKHFDFSSHACKSDLIKMLDTLQFKGEKKVFCVHGDEETLTTFANVIKELNYSAEIPDANQIFIV